MSIRGKQDNHYCRKNDQNTIHNRSPRTRKQNRWNSDRGRGQTRQILRFTILTKNNDRDTDRNRDCNHPRQDDPWKKRKETNSTKAKIHEKEHNHRQPGGLPNKDLHDQQNGEGNTIICKRIRHSMVGATPLQNTDRAGGVGHPPPYCRRRNRNQNRQNSNRPRLKCNPNNNFTQQPKTTIKLQKKHSKEKHPKNHLPKKNIPEITPQRKRQAPAQPGAKVV